LITEHRAKTEHFLARQGQALIWCANLLHGGSLQNNPTLTRWSQVTHYFFDDCVYYTPGLSDEYLGRLALRQLVSITDRSPKPNLYLGEKIAPTSVAPSHRKPLHIRWGKWVVRAFRSRKAASNSATSK